jgi:hypothetical protein
MDARSELLAYLGTALLTVTGLFGLQYWYATYLDVYVVHASLYDVAPDEKVAAQRDQERAQVAGAMNALAQRGRGAFPKIAPKSSEDLSAMAGWMHRPNFQPYVPRRQRVPVLPAGAGEPAEGGAAEGGDAPAQDTDAEPAPAAPAGAQD